jgi:hypothetical protein
MSRSRLVRCGVLALLALCATSVYARPGAEPRHFNLRGGFFAQVDFDVGGDDVVYDDRFEIEDTSTGEGEQILLGMFYRPWKAKPIEIYVGGGIKSAHIIPCGNCPGGNNGQMDRWVLEIKGQYRFTPRLFVGAGLVHHGDITLARWEQPDLRFKPATGLFVEGGWSFLGLHATYMEYKPKLGGPSIDASTVGARFLIRF